MNQLLTRKHHLNLNLDIIVEGCVQNETHCQEQLYKLCYPEMIKICYRYAWDSDSAGIIYNNAMLRVFKNIGDYKDEGKLMSWIRTIVINCSIDFCKKKNIFKKATPHIAEDEISLLPEVFDKVSGKEIQQLIRQLPAATATVFNLYIYDGFTHKQIGEQLGISEGTSKWHVSEAKKSLKLKLENFLKTQIRTNAAG
jgi:RNA polymerase sigma factor (sigma-70 family)